LEKELMMWKRLGVVVLVLLFLAVGCSIANQNKGVQETAVNDTAVFAPPTPDMPVYWDTVHAAEAAYEASDFEQAMTLAQEAAAISPTDSAAWDVFQLASVAKAGDTYLQNLPDRRYRKTPEQFLADVSNGMHYFIIDVREPDEFAVDHIENAVNIPLHDLVQQLDQLPESKGQPILVYCHTQKRSTHALVVLREVGYTNVWNLEGGWAEYEAWTAVNPMPTPGPTATPAPEPPSC
jgi:rhodanese-related sulfurtransferase